jgi:hypothetical protein
MMVPPQPQAPHLEQGNLLHGRHGALADDKRQSSLSVLLGSAKNLHRALASGPHREPSGSPSKVLRDGGSVRLEKEKSKQ